MAGQRKRQVKDEAKVPGLSSWKDGVIKTKIEPKLDECGGEDWVPRAGGIQFLSVTLKWLLDLQVVYPVVSWIYKSGIEERFGLETETWHS